MRTTETTFSRLSTRQIRHDRTASGRRQRSAPSGPFAIHRAPAITSRTFCPLLLPLHLRFRRERDTRARNAAKLSPFLILIRKLCSLANGTAFAPASLTTSVLSPRALPLRKSRVFIIFHCSLIRYLFPWEIQSSRLLSGPPIALIRHWRGRRRGGEGERRETESPTYYRSRPVTPNE